VIFYIVYKTSYKDCVLQINLLLVARMVWSYRKNAGNKNGQSNTLLEPHFKEANGKTKDTLGAEAVLGVRGA
jgi:hypothetical protein